LPGFYAGSPFITMPARPKTSPAFSFLYDSLGKLTASTGSLGYGNWPVLLSRQILRPADREVPERRSYSVPRWRQLLSLCVKSAAESLRSTGSNTPAKRSGKQAWVQEKRRAPYSCRGPNVSYPSKPFRCNTYKNPRGEIMQTNCLPLRASVSRWESRPLVCRMCYLPKRSASDVLLEPAGHAAKLFPGHRSVVSNCVGGCDG
jgi:hypothetical protein